MAKTSDQSLNWFILSCILAQVANMILIYKIRKQKSVYGVSIDSQISLLFATLARCAWFSDTRLPTMWVAIFEIGLAVVLHSYIVFQCVKYKDELQYKMPIYLRWFCVVTVASILSLLKHPGGHGDYYITQ